MKQLIIITLSVILLSFSACSKDNTYCWRFDVTVTYYFPDGTNKTITGTLDECGLTEKEASEIEQPRTDYYDDGTVVMTEAKKTRL